MGEGGGNGCKLKVQLEGFERRRGFKWVVTRVLSKGGGGRGERVFKGGFKGRGGGGEAEGVEGGRKWREVLTFPAT